MSEALAAPKPAPTGPQAPGRSPCIHEVFEAQAERTPHAIALTCGEERLTYHELNERANQLAHRLRRLGVTAEIPVALYLERSTQMVVSILGVLKAGGAYVPIDLAYPPERLGFMLADTQAPILLTQQSLRAKLPPAGARILCLDSDSEEMEFEPRANPTPVAHPDNAAYIIYTSGSTGKPKGVLVTHHNVVRLLKSTAHWYEFGENDVWPLFHSYAFDVSVWELWGALFHGGRLVVVPYLVTRSPSDFYELLEREKVTVLNQTPSAFRQLIWAESNAAAQRKLPLRYVICAGEALELQSLRPWFERHGDQKPTVVNMYGITETTVHSTYRVIRTSDVERGRGSVIGVPIPDLQLHLVDENLKPVPPGIPGEICVGGAGVARGYLNRPELTSQRFLPDPFSSEVGARIYRSGDLAQINAEGELEYLGRMDHQVKIRGFRVELGEIESALNRHPGIRESVVVAHTSDENNKRLVAYAVARDQAPTVTELRAYLGGKVPDYMLPSVFMFLPSLPLTTNGKVDRRALPSPDGARPELSSGFVEPRTETEQTLAKIWAEVLKVDRVGVNDNYFDLGGDSIRSIQVLSRARASGLRYSLEDILRNPTIGGLAQLTTHRAPEADTGPTTPFSLVSSEDRAQLPPDVEDAYPLTRLQMGMFYYNELDPLSAIYHDVFSYRLQAEFQPEKLKEAILRLAQRHPQLRTSFHISGFSQALQLVHRNALPSFTVEDLREQGSAEQKQALTHWIEAEKRRPFQRTQAPLVRFHSQWLTDTAFQLIISFHHACLDGWSLAAVITEVCQDYLALLKGSEPANIAPRATYRDFVGLEQRAIASPETRRFWNQKLENAGAPKLPRWPAELRAGGHEQMRGPELKVPDKHYASLRDLARAAGVPLKTVLLAAHQRVMALMYGTSEVTTGLICNGRPEELDGEKIIGLFLNTLPLRQNLAAGTWLDLVNQTFQAEQELLPHRRFPLAEIQKLCGGQAPFETAFDFVHFHVYSALQGCGELDLSEGHYFEANNLTTYTTFMLDTTSSKLELHIDYDPNALCREQIEQMSDYYLTTIEAMATDPQSRYETFSPLSELECRRMLNEWNATAQEFPRSQCIDQLFDVKAKEAGEAIAVEFNGVKMTYRQLQARADRLAQGLTARGVRHQDLIGICVERSPEMLVALLGILKAGAAYVPLDPAYPAERLGAMIRDSRLKLIVTQSSLVQSLATTGAQTLCVEELLNAEPVPGGCLSDESGFGESREYAADHAERSGTDLAYVIYTSGSTGKPKGVQITHRSVVNLLASAARTTAISAMDKLLAVTTLSFDIAGLELFMPLITGGRVLLADREAAGNGTQLSALIESSQPTVMQATPATWRLLIEAGWQESQRLKILCGGEALTRGLANELLSRASEVWNFYGPTETTIWSTAWKVTPKGAILVGRPLANTQAYILDAGLRLVPVGTIGELHLGGEGLARGYLGQAELTSERFIPSPFAPGERIYRTGDLARYLPDGQIECLGRVDHQVKIRGFRIEPGDIEAALKQHQGIAEALVTSRQSHSGDKQLVGYLISKNGPPSPAELRDFLKARLPAYMVPSHFVLLERFPLTPNGKIDRRALPSPERAQASSATYTAPRNGDERTLASIWQEVLMLDQVGIDDDFLELGGDSLSATRAFARVNRAFETSLTLREMLDHPTIRSMAELVTKQKGTASGACGMIPRQPRASRRVSPQH